jgi:DNA-binding NarL/FixJ family response regulator
VRAGAIDADAAAAVLDVAGHKHTGLHRQLSADLTSREIEVLRRIAEGRSGKEIARALGISPKTADNHTQSIYSKIRVSTRAAATLFAIEHGLLTPQRWSK